ncbi:hypothetical protein [Catenuloplanes japonicus]|uniref:hypothetical protein n=1 Tax=Catenuloplanes japonicus TaxID=33876 RepID=UPI000525EF18|nr:hypothetical protein [Catenuloplanes japonicus]
MTAPALTAAATGDHQPWCARHVNGTCYSAPDLIPDLSSDHFGQLTVEKAADGEPLLSVDVGNVELDLAGVEAYIVQLRAAAARMAEASR